MKQFKMRVVQIRKIQRKVKSWLYARRYRRTLRAVIIMQSCMRAWLQYRKYERMKKAAITIQKYVKGWICRKKVQKLLNPSNLRASSRTSYSSSSVGYYSVTTTLSSLTDISISDAETLSINEVDPFRFSLPPDTEEKRRLLLETEESGLESDTESLSGAGHKSGRNSKLQNRRRLESFSETVAKATAVSISDEDEAMPNTKVKKPRRIPITSYRSKLFPSKLISKSLQFQLQQKIQQNNDLQHINAEDEQLHNLRLKTLQHFQNISSPSSILNSKTFSTHQKYKVQQLYMPSCHLPIFFRDGILSYRQLPSVS